jgi:chromosome segregation ATPase
MVECSAQFSRKLENVEKEIKNLNIKIDKCNQNTSEQQKGDNKSLALERICSKIDKLTENVKSITEKQNGLVMNNCEQMQKLTKLENMTKEVKTVTETRKEDQTLHVHVRQTSDDKDEIDSNEYFPIIRKNTNSVPYSE